MKSFEQKSGVILMQYYQKWAYRHKKITFGSNIFVIFEIIEIIELIEIFEHFFRNNR